VVLAIGAKERDPRTELLLVKSKPSPVGSVWQIAQMALSRKRSKPARALPLGSGVPAGDTPPPCDQ